MKIIIQFFILLFLSFSVVFFGCNESKLIEPVNSNIEVSYTSSKDTVDKLLNVLTLDTVKILLKDVKLHSISSDSTNYAIGPFVITLYLNKSINSLGITHIQDGSYDKITFEVHKLEPNEPVPDPEFRDSLGNNYSVVAKGYFNGTRFVYKSTKSAKQILNFPAAITLTSGYVTNITLLVKPLIWFKKDYDYMDPNNPANWNDIDNNIKNNINQNFRAFKDNDKNGIPDN